MRLLLGIAGCGAAGALARYALGAWLQEAANLRFPVGTLVINVLGSFLLGLLFAAADRLAPEWRVAVGTGFLGAFTTFSTFSVDTVRLIGAGEPRLALLNAAGSLALGLLAAWGGLSLGAALQN